MYSIIRDFSLGNVNPNEHGNRRNAEYQKVAKALMEAEGELLSALNENEKMLYEKFATLQMKLSTMEEAEKFEQGYILGAYFSFEVMSRIDDMTL